MNPWQISISRNQRSWNSHLNLVFSAFLACNVISVCKSATTLCAFSLMFLGNQWQGRYKFAFRASIISQFSPEKAIVYDDEVRFLPERHALTQLSGLIDGEHFSILTKGLWAAERSDLERQDWCLIRMDGLTTCLPTLLSHFSDRAGQSNENMAFDIMFPARWRTAYLSEVR